MSLAPPPLQPYSSLRETSIRSFAVPLEKQAVWAGRAAAAQQTLDERPADPAALQSLARAEFAQGRFEAAATAAEQAVQASPESADAAWLRAMTRERLGDRTGAMADANRAALLDPSRYAGRAAIAAAGGSLFDPGSDDSWGLLEQMGPPPKAEGRTPWVLLLFLLLAGAGGAAAYAGRALWNDLPAENKQRVMSVLRKAAPKGSFPVPRAATPMPVKASAALKPGASLGAKFDLVGQVGRDGTVEVWKAHDRTLGRDVLLKRLYAGPDSGELDLRRADAKQAAGLHHPNIVELYEIVELPEGLFAVYEYASGKSLRQVLSEKKTLSLRQTRDVLIPVCRALEHAHRRGIAHGGLSPERIILTRQGYVKVIDFVLARTTGAGTEAYSAPETRRGAPTPASDVYSLGMVLHELLVGERPGEGELEPPASFARILESALDLDARSRTQSARKCLEDLPVVNAATLPPRPIEA
ncbi:MAG: protein kinase, partial [Elusimicrobia bacterium]|nr:protein kinase [Elusimicrobiota bacterium]